MEIILDGQTIDSRETLHQRLLSCCSFRRGTEEIWMRCMTA